MARTAPAGSLTSSTHPRRSLVIERARKDDDAQIRRLLREQPMDGALRLSLEREPSAWVAGAIGGDRHHMIVARDTATGEVAGMGSRSVRPVWVNNEEARVGYLGMLRRDPARAPTLRILGRAFDEVDRTRLPDELPYDITTIVSENTSARRLLERGLPGFPAYHLLGELTTIATPLARRAREPAADVVEGSDHMMPAIAECLQRNLRRFQFAPIWTVGDLRSPDRTRNLKPSDFLTKTEGSRVVACLARWNQRGFKQAVVRGYSPRLRRWRSAVNVALRTAQRPPLPPSGHELRIVYASHMAADAGRQDDLVDLVSAARRSLGRSDADYLVAGFSTANPWLPAVARALPTRTYRSNLYAVVHDRSDANAPIELLRGRTPHVEVATL